MEIYADYAATTPVKPEVVDAMMTIYNSHYGNPSSIHAKGRDARKYLDESRRQIAQLLGADTHEIIFTSGATESNNTAIKGIVKANEQLGNHIITSKIEHHSVLHVFEQLEREGFDVTYLDVDDTGAIDLDQLEETITDKTILVSIMFVNNEVGTVQQIYDIQDIIFEPCVVKTYGTLTHNKKRVSPVLNGVKAKLVMPVMCIDLKQCGVGICLVFFFKQKTAYEITV